MATQKPVMLTVNGRRHEMSLPAHRTLLEVLRDLGYAEVKCGCEKGDCGACAVLLDGEAVDACVTLAWQADAAQVTTVRGLAKPGEEHPLHTAFIQTGAVQCGYCIPGMIIAAKALLDDHPDPTDEEIRRGLSGNLCRCTGYVQIFAAVRDAAAAMRGAGGKA
jgi:aerobic carbon-monoxide dehydrogenase small subunit